MKTLLGKIITIIMALTLTAMSVSGFAMSSYAASDDNFEISSGSDTAEDTDSEETSSSIDEQNSDLSQPVSDINDSFFNTNDNSVIDPNNDSSKNSDIHTAVAGQGDRSVSVTTFSRPGVIPEGAVLHVTPISIGAPEYSGAANVLSSSNINYEGMLALDIGFTLNGEAIEPENGSVEVSIHLGPGYFPDDIDQKSLTVSHLSEGRVADTAAASASSGGSVSAAVEVESFSTFTITWGRTIINYYVLTVHHVDGQGREIGTTTRSDNKSISENETIYFADLIKQFPGYTYSGAHIDSYNGDQITHVTATNETYLIFGGSLHMRFYNGSDSTPVKDIAHDIELSIHTDRADIYLVYEPIVYYNVTIRKDVTGNMGDNNRSFAFNCNGENFTLMDKDSHSSSVKTYSVLAGTPFVVSESDYSADGYSTSYSINGAAAVSGNTCNILSVTADTEITFINSKDIPPATGSDIDIRPMLVMFLIAVISGVLLLLSGKAGRKDRA